MITVILNFHYRGDKLQRNHSQTTTHKTWEDFIRQVDRMGGYVEIFRDAEGYRYFRGSFISREASSEFVGVAKL